ncbi:MAG: hypothetical protein A2W25_12015 [candidate division Zixibacteria bacterium RBG_16_53_22]|nr:MAG: hypothetical protein A2W25_12015 [candidate division Zixibacteria bacterium RBG_16_53_22]
MHDATAIKYSNHYSEEGSGYGYLAFNLKRKVGYDYQDIGFGYRAILRKGINMVLFDGVIVKIDETHGGEGDQIVVGCVGWNSLLAFDVKNFILSDSRLNRWLGSQVVSGSFTPDKFDANNSWTVDDVSYSGLQFKPRRGSDYIEDDYTYLRYTFEFGETVAKLSYDWETAFPNSWPGKFEVLDANGTVLHSETVTGSGSKTLSISGGNHVEIRMYVTQAGESTAEDNTVYIRLQNVIVYSTRDTVDMARVMQEAVEHMSDNFGFSSDTSYLNATGYPLPQAAFDTDQTLDEVLKWCAQFGGAGYAPLAWGMQLNDKKRMFVELQDLSTVKYVVPRASATSANVSGDWATSVQKIYAVSQNQAGDTVRSSVYSDTGQIERLGGLYRKEVVQAGQITPEQAIQAARYRLSEIGTPKITSSFTVSGHVQMPGGARVPIDEIQAGGLVEIRDFRAREASLTPNDLRTGYTVMQLVGVEIDLESYSATLIPAGDRGRYERYLARLTQLARG